MNRLPFRDKVLYGIGDLACGIAWVSIGNFLLFFYTNVFGIGAVAAGTLIFVARAWDAVWDLFLGGCIDRTRTRWGQARPYLLFGGPILAITAMAVFTVPDVSPDGKLIYAWVTYILMMMAYSTVNIPYSSLAPLLTDDPADRTQLAAVRMFFAYAALLGVGALTMPMVDYFGASDPAKGFHTTVLILMTISLLLLLLCFAGVKERITPLKPKHTGRGDDLRQLARCRSWQVQFLVALVVFTTTSLASAVVLYYFAYVIGNAAAASGFFLSMGLGMMTGSVVSARLVKTLCKRNLMICAQLIAALLTVGMYWAHALPLLGLYALVFAINIAVGAGKPIVWSMLADTADHVELLTGRRLAGLTTSTQAFATKLGLGISGALAGGLLALIGYQAGQDQQSIATQDGLRLLICVGPLVGYLLVALLLTQYPLNRTSLARLHDDLRRQRQSTLL